MVMKRSLMRSDWRCRSLVYVRRRDASAYIAKVTADMEPRPFLEPLPKASSALLWLPLRVIEKAVIM